MKRSHRPRVSVLCVGLFVVAASGVARAGVTVQFLPQPYDNTTPTCVSAGGGHIVGYTQDVGARTEQILWGPDRSYGTVPYLGGIIPGAMTGDGQVTAGYITTAVQHAYRWTAATGVTLLSTRSDSQSFAFGISRDQQWILGDWVYPDNTGVAVAWDRSGFGFSTFQPALGSTSATAYAASNASLVVGTSWSNNQGRATTWTSSALPGAVLPTLPGYIGSQAGSVSSDGRIIAGVLNTTTNWFDLTPVRWVDGVIAPLPLLPGTSLGTASFMSDDGSIILGNCWGPGGNNVRPTLWIDGQPVGVRDLLLENGIAPSIANSISISCLSSDGMFIGGWWSGGAHRPVIIEIPAPWTVGVVAAGLVSVRRRIPQAEGGVAARAPARYPGV